MRKTEFRLGKRMEIMDAEMIGTKKAVKYYKRNYMYLHYPDISWLA